MTLSSFKKQVVLADLLKTQFALYTGELTFCMIYVLITAKPEQPYLSVGSSAEDKTWQGCPSLSNWHSMCFALCDHVTRNILQILPISDV